MRLVLFLLSIATASPPVSEQDTIVVRADNAPVWGPTVRFTRELRIGEAEGAEEYTFGRISSVAVGMDGSIFVVDPSVPTVRQFTATGKYVRSFGRRGSGPGELLNPEVAAVSDNRLIVRDLRNQRLVIYPIDGAEPGHWSYPSTSASWKPLVVHADGAVSVPFSVHRGNAVFEPAVLRYQPNGSIRDTLLVPNNGPPAPMLVVRGSASGGVARYSIGYFPHPVWEYTPSRLFIGGHPSRYSIVLLGGPKPIRIDRRAEAVPITAAERRDIQEGTEQSIRSSNDPNYKWNGPPVPSTKPFYKTLNVDADGRIWVGLHAPSVRVDPSRPNARPYYREPPVYDVMLPTGQYLGQIRFPDNFSLQYVRGDQVWGTETDALGVQYVVRYRTIAR